MAKADRRKIDPSVSVSDLEEALEEFLEYMGSRDLNNVFARLTRMQTTKGVQGGLHHYGEYHTCFLHIAKAVKSGKIPSNKLAFAIQNMPQEKDEKKTQYNRETNSSSGK